ncbi:MAG: flagellar FliJ family protein [Bacteriovoracaceae bacterium]|jgi:flagellar export protein FliJ|nr:flagellar FliJ family protein [Bacteriovoracaceae bacterium]
MKKYKYKLDALIKMRKIKEDRCKMEIGRIQNRIKELEGFKKGHIDFKEQTYKAQEEILKTNATVSQVGHIPSFIETNLDHIERIDDEIKWLEEQRKSRIIQLGKLKSDVKVIESMKEKDFSKYKKEFNKKQNETIEELVQIWTNTKDAV